MFLPILLLIFLRVVLAPARPVPEGAGMFLALFLAACFALSQLLSALLILISNGRSRRGRTLG